MPLPTTPGPGRASFPYILLAEGVVLISDSLITRTHAFIAQHDLLPRGARVLIGLSGGIDSMTLVDVLFSLAPEWDWELHALYVHHGLRPEADAEALELGRWCAERGLPYHAERVKLDRAGKSPEEAARHARYAAFNATAAALGAKRIALAHHADDQLETVLFRWVQGAGSGGLSGMRPLREQASGPPVVRPFLEIPRAEIVAYHQERGLPFWEDRTNRSEDFPRNVLRHRVLPVLDQLNPSLRTALPLHLQLLHEEHEWLTNAARTAEEGLRRLEEDGLLAWGREGFRALPRVLQRRILHRAYREVGGRMRRLTARGIERVLDRWEEGTPGGIDLADGVRAVLQGDFVALDRDPEPFAPIPLERAAFAAGEPRAIAFEGGLLTLQTVSAGKQGPADPDTVAFAAEDWPEDAVLRRAEPETDRFQPWGHRGTHALNRFMSKQRIFEPARRRFWVIASGSEVLWVLGLRRSARYPLTGREKAVFTASWGRKQGLTTPSLIPTMKADR